MTELLIIADDLTGAIDTGVQLAKQHIQTHVIPQPEIDYEKLFENEKTTVLVVNTESRHIAPEEATLRLKNVMVKARKAGISRFFKKTDSTLRGNIGAEIEAFKKSISQKFIGFIPAHPKLKRFTIEGHHFVDNVPLHKTAFANDPLEPITQSNIKEILCGQLTLSVANIELQKHRLPPNSEILIFDCKEIKDLKSILDFLMDHSCANAIAGSAAIVELLPEFFQLKSLKTSVPAVDQASLLINGSLNHISRKQVQVASELGIKSHSIPRDFLQKSVSFAGSGFSELLTYIQEAYSNNEEFMLSTTPIKKTQNSLLPEKSTLDPTKVSICSGVIVKSILEQIPYSTIVIFGGDTLMGIIQSLECDYIEPKLEILPGVALSVTFWYKKQICLITKPGGYGDSDVIAQIFQYLKTSIT